MNFAEAYGDTTYGGGTYNEAPTTTTPSPAPTTRTTQPTQTNQTTAQDTETPTTASDDTPITSTNETPRTTTSQPAAQDSFADKTATVIDTTPMWAIIAAVIALSAFVALLVVIVKKLANR